jgi:hypothetical protein
MATYDLGKVVGDAGEKGDDGSTVWNTSTAPSYANSKYTFTISNLSGKTGLQIAVNDIIFYSTYYYIVSAVNTTTVDCSTRVSIKGSDASVTIVDNLTTNDATKVLSAKQGKVLNDNKLEKTHSSYKGKNVVTNATTGTIEFEDKPTIPTKTSDLTNDGADGTNVFVANNDSRLSDARTPTSHTHGNLTNDGKVGSNANYIVVTGTGGAITSVQKLGNITYDGKIGSTSGKPVITTTSGTLTTGSFGSTSGTFAEGNHTHSGYISTSSTTGLIKNDGTIMTSGTGSSNYAAGNHTHSGYVSTSDIADNLTTNDSTKVLSAKQGYQLNQLIGQAIAYINM